MAEEGNNENKKRPYLGIWFECCNVYGRLYKSKDGKTYRGRCPRCLRQAIVRIGGEGTNRRFFRGS